MKVAAISTVFFVTLSLASPAPAPNPEPEAAESRSITVDTAVAARKAAPAPNFETLAAGLQIESRAPKKGKGSKGSSGGNNTSIAVSLSPSRVLELGALGLGVVEVLRLWC